jgi:hypothetical protein
MESDSASSFWVTTSILSSLRWGGGSPRLLVVDLIACEEVGVIRQELLQEGLGVVARLLHRDQLGFAV